MEIISYKNLYVNSADDNKWFISYVLTYSDGSCTKARKEYGKKSYDISMNKEKDLIKRKVLANKLLKLVQADIEKGIDPQLRNEIIDERNRVKLVEAQKADDARISFDAALDMLKREKGWINPSEGKEAAARVIPTMLTSSFKPFLEDIGKVEDIRAVTRMDVKNFIERHFNAPKDSEIATWSAATCSAAKARVSILFGVLIEKDLIEFNPTVGVKVKTDSQKIEQNEDDEDLDRFEPWTSDEVENWFNGFKGGVEFPTRITTDVIKLIETTSYILHYAFIRKSEILRLRCSMIDFENERFVIPPKITKSASKIKSKNLLHVDIPTPLLNALRAWKDYKFPDGCNANDYLFFKDKPSVPYIYVTFIENFTRIRKIYQDKYDGLYINKNQYALKHTGVIKLFNVLAKSRKTPIEIQTIIKNQCRHSSFSQTETYLRKLHLEFKESREKIEF